MTETGTLSFYCITIFCWACCFPLSNTAQPINVRKLTVNDGLPQGLVRGMVQDRQGFVWIASEGLSRYDGKNFVNYKHSIDDTTSIASNDIRELQIDDKDNLWIVYASKEVDILNAATGQMRHLTNEPAFRWMKAWGASEGYVIRQAAGHYFTAFDNGLATFNAKTGRSEQILLPAGEKLLDIGSDDAGKPVIATTRAMYRLQTNRVQSFYHFPPLPDSVYKAWDTSLSNSKVVGTVLKPKSGKWILPAVGGIYVYNPVNKSCSYAGAPKDKMPYLAVLAKDGNIYYLHGAGLYSTNGNAPPVLVYSNEDDGPLNPSLLADRSGILWVSVGVTGLRLFSLQHNNFRSFSFKGGFAEAALQPWLPVISNDASYSSYNIRSAKDTSGNIYVLNDANYYHNGRFIRESWDLYRLQGSKVTRYPLNDSGRKLNLFTFDKYNQCWVIRYEKNSLKRVLAKVNLQTGSVVPFVRLPEKWIENSYLSSIGNEVCFLQEDELQLYHITTGSCRIFSKAQLGIGCIMLMAVPDKYHPNLLWIATRGDGIIKLDIATGKAVHYNENTGLPNNTVYFMAPDKKGQFWCSSNKGLFRFNPADGSVVAFTVKDGLQGNEFNRYHFLETPDGHFWFGGTEGNTVFHPDSIYLDNYETPVAITDVQVNNVPLQQVAPKWRHSIASSLQQLTLAYDQNYLGFSFAGLQYNDPEKLQYRYLLEEVDKDWVYAGHDATAKYASLQPGHYRLKVNASNTAGKWSSYIKTLDITITPPWWRMGWAYLVYCLIIIGIVYALYRNWLHRVTTRQQVILKQKQAEQAQALEETKSRFFANITHELRTPLTLILSPVQQQLQEEATTFSPQLLQGVYQNSQTLLRLINQLLDMSKLEAGNMPLTLSRGDIDLFVKGVVRTFSQPAKARNILLTYENNDFNLPPTIAAPVHTPMPPAPVREDTNRGGEGWEEGISHGNEEYLFDSDKLEKILYNLLSNSLKFTPDGGNITVARHQQEVLKDKVRFAISVSDSGIGIAPEHLPHIFDRFYQVNTSTTRRYEGTGIGLSLVKEFTDLMGGEITVESQSGSGSVFTLSLPLTIATGEEPATVVTLPKPADFTKDMEVITEPAPVQNDDKPLVLVTDDNEQLRNFIAASLSPYYRVLTAANGEAGLQTTLAELPELIISDVMMPVMDGYEFCQQVKENPLTSHIGFILLTAKTADESRVSGLRLGADHYIGKPFIVEELLLVAANLLKRQQQLRELYSKQLQQPTNKLPPVNEVEDAFLQSVYSVIETHLDSDKLDVDLLATEMAVSRRTLNRRLATVADTSANELIRNYRLKKAAGLLLSGQGVSEAAYATGFSTPSYFSQCFKEMYGQSPGQWADNRYSSSN